MVLDRPFRLLGWLAVAAGFVLAPATAWAGQPSREVQGGTLLTVDEVAANWAKLTPKQQFVALEQLLRAGQFEQAEALLAQSHYASETDKLMAQFYTALVRKQQGRGEEAAAILRELLAAHPEFDRVRLELADTLFAIEQDESARHNFELILGSAGTNPDLARTVRAYIDAIDSRRLWDLSVYTSLVPSSNFNQGADTRVVQVNGLPFALADRNVRKSGIGLAFGAQGSARVPLGDRLDLIASAGINGRRYTQGAFNDALVNGAFGPRYRFEWGSVGVYATAEHHWYGGEDFHGGAGGLVSAIVRLSTTDIVFSDLSCSERRFNTHWSGNDLSGQDGLACGINTRLEHHLDAATFANVIANVKREQTKLDFFTDTSWSAGAGLYRELALGISAYAQAVYTRASFEGVFPTLDRGRRDDRLEATLNLTKRDLVLFGLAPTLALSYTLNDSNVAFQRFDSYGLNLTLTKRF